MAGGFINEGMMYQREGFSDGLSSDLNSPSISCDKCPELRSQLQENKVRYEETLKDEKKKYEEIIENERKQYSQLLEIYENLKQRSDHYMSKVISRNEDIEDTSNKLSNSKIAERFGKIRKKEWRRLFKCMENKSGDEVETVYNISNLLRGVYEKCKIIADGKVRQLASLGDNDDLPDKTEYRDVYRCRRMYGQTKHARENTLLKISEECLQTFLLNEESGCSASETKSENVNHTESSIIDSKLTDATREFLEKCVDCCWLMVISQPVIELTFDVVGKIYTQSMEESFMKYSTQAKVTDTRSVGTVVSVVWPELDDSHGTRSKGIVVTVDNCRHETSVPVCLD